MRGMIPAQAPYEGREPTMRKGSYSEELVKIVRFHVCSRNATGAVDPSTATSDFPQPV